ncbi:unnamed protein product [Sphagnum balticum]
MFCVSDEALRLIDETLPSYQRKTAGKIPLSERHLMALVEANNNQLIQFKNTDRLPDTSPAAYNRYESLAAHDTSVPQYNSYSSNQQAEHKYTPYSTRATVADTRQSDMPAILITSPNTPKTPPTPARQHFDFSTATTKVIAPKVDQVGGGRPRSIRYTRVFQFDPHSFCRELLDESLTGTRTLPKSQRTKTSSSMSSSHTNDRSAAAFDSALMLIQSAAASERPMQHHYQRTSRTPPPALPPPRPPPRSTDLLHEKRSRSSTKPTTGNNQKQSVDALTTDMMNNLISGTIIPGTAAAGGECRLFGSVYDTYGHSCNIVSGSNALQQAGRIELRPCARL